MLAHLTNNRRSTTGMSFARLLLLLVLCNTVVECQSSATFGSNSAIQTGTYVDIQDFWNRW
jgi:hypothetical protein